MAKYFVNPFAKNGDKLAVPDAVQVDGSVSYDSGFGFDYERDPDPLVDPLTKDIPRDQTNQLFFDITDNLKNWQDNTAPEWSSIRAATGGGYKKNSRVFFGGQLYVSRLDNNSAQPNAPIPTNYWTSGIETDATIIAMSLTAPAANQIIYFTAPDVASVTGITSFGRSFINLIDAAAAKVALGIQVATDSVFGLLRIATNAEINAAAAVEAAVNPEQLRLGFDFNASTTGHLVLPSWLFGVGFRWAKVNVPNGGGSVLVNWSRPFDNALFFAGCNYADGGSTATYWLAGQSGLTGYYVDHNSASDRQMFVWAFGY